MSSPSRNILLSSIAITNSIANVATSLLQFMDISPKGRDAYMDLTAACSHLTEARRLLANAADRWKEGGD